MKNALFLLFGCLFNLNAMADVALYLPVDDMSFPAGPAHIRVYGGHTKALHDLLPMDPDSDGTKLRVMTRTGFMTVVACTREYIHPGTGKSIDNYQCIIATGPEVSEKQYWPIEPLDMGGPYSGPEGTAGVMGLDPGQFPQDGQIAFWGGSAHILAENLPKPVTFKGPHWNLLVGCQKDYVDPKTKVSRHDYQCKLILRGN